MTDPNLHERLANLTPEQRKELSARIQASGKKDASPKIHPVTSRSAEDPLVPSFAQQRLWFLHQLDPMSPAYNVPLALRLVGPLDIVALKAAMEEVLRRHEVLRTSFPDSGDHPVPKVDRELSLPWSYQDIREVAPENREGLARRLVEEETKKPFDLAGGPAIRFLLVRQDADDHILVITMHHIVSDGWSLGIINQEISQLYAAFSRGEPSPLPELSIQYADFAYWQRDWMRDEVLQRQQGYWTEQLRGVPTLELPTDGLRPPVQTFEGSHEAFVVPAPLKADLQKLGQQEGVTLAITLQAVFNVLLYRYTHQDDIVVGSPIANRTREEVEGLVGFFVNNLVMRTDLSGDPTALEVIRRVREVAFDAYDHQDLPFEHLVHELRPERDPSRNPLFQIMFAVQNAPAKEVKLEGVSVEPLPMEGTTTRFDLECHFFEHQGHLQGRFVYNVDLFDRTTMQRMVRHFLRLLASVAEDPNCPISSLPLMTAEERTEVDGWSGHPTPYPRDATVHELFEAQVDRSPHATAVEFGDQKLSYKALDQRANRLAHWLRSQGVGPDVLVGLGVERSMEMVVGTLGILKAGGAYLPLDPDYPTSRLEFMLQDADCSVLLTQRKLLERLPHQDRITLCLDDEFPEEPREAEEAGLDHGPPDSEARAGHLAYVMYTSGSTGQPKGSAVEHRSVVRLVMNTNYVELGPEEVFLQFAPLSFDAATFELWGSLLHGAKLVVCPPGKIALAELGDLIQTNRVSVLWLTGAVFQQMVDFQLDKLKGIRQLLSGGEALSVPHVKRVLENLEPGHRLINGYGPTENTTFTCCHVMDDQSVVAGTVPIGRPIANTTVRILDEHLNPVPVGVSGELLTGGDGLARGYLNQPELTAAQFIESPSGPGTRLYRTGDRARFLADGTIEFLGRQDGQVKLRGFRIELGEIESTLADDPFVREAVAMVREDMPGDRRLVAYLVPDREAWAAYQDDQASEGDLDDVHLISLWRTRLQGHIPSYMVPSAFVILDELPVTPNGKVDRRALPKPTGVRQLTSEYAPPESEIEKTLVEIWQDVLQVERVGRHDNFFDLGGHSLLATQVMSRLRESLEHDVPLMTMFEEPTPAGLAERIEAIGPIAESGGKERQIVPRNSTALIPLSFAQQRLWFLHQLDPTSPAYNVPLARRLVGSLDIAALKASIKEVLRRHEVLRTSFPDTAGVPRQEINPEIQLAWDSHDFSGSTPAEIEGLLSDAVRRETTRPFDLKAGPVARFTLFCISESEHVLTMVFHHIVTDAWSIGVFNREVSTLYEAFSAGKPSPLTDPTLQYSDFAEWQRNRLVGDLLEGQLHYWRAQLKGLKHVDLPTDRPRPPYQPSRGAVHHSDLTEATSGLLLSAGASSGATLWMIVQAAFATLLGRLTQQEDICIGSPIASRDRVEVEGLMGFFLNTLAIRTDLSGNPSFSELLERVRTTAVEAYGHQSLPFELLVEDLQPERDPSQNPLFQVSCTVQHAQGESLSLPGLRIEPFDVGAISTHFDIDLHLYEADGRHRLVVFYNPDLFDAETISRFERSFQTLLHAALENPRSPIWELPIRLEGEGTPRPAEETEPGSTLPAPSAAAMNTSELLSLLRSKGVGISASGDRLKLKAPPGVLTADLRSEIAEQKNEILSALQVATEAQDTGSIPRIPRDQDLFASYAQQRLWFLDQFAPGSPVYNIPSAIRTFRLDEKALGRAVDALIDRHEVFRTSFVASEGLPRLRIHPPSVGNLEVVDLQALPEKDREKRVHEIVLERSRKGFLLSESPLIRVSLLQLDSKESVLIWCVHHIVSDGWSLGIIGRDLTTLYFGFRSGQPADLPELPIQFADYAAWQRERVHSDTVRGQLAYWKKQLDGELPVVELPADRPRPPIQTFAGARKKVEIPPETLEALKDLSRQEGVTLFMTLLAAFKVFLSRFTGVTDVVVGTPTAGRDQPELENLPGFFVNNLVLRTDLSEAPTFRKLLDLTKSVVLNAHANQEVPFDQLVEVLRPERSVAHPPLFQVMFNSPTVPQEKRKWGDRAEAMEFQVGTSRFDLTVEVFEHFSGPSGAQKAEGLSAYFEYNTDLFDEDSIERFQASYSRILQAVIESPDKPIPLLPILPKKDRQRVLYDWNDTGVEYPDMGLIHDRVASHAEGDPDKVAISDGQESLTYRELQVRSSRLAAHLVELGVGPGVLVGLCVHRSVEMPVALLAILKAGGGYVPLDPTYPKDRLQFMLEDSNAAFLVTQASLDGLFPAGLARVVLIDGEGSEGGEGMAPPPAPAVKATPEDLAYVIYTSGSTGKPKGVQIQHGALANFLNSMAREPGMDSDDHLLAVTTLSFDISGLELFLPLFVGASLTIVRRAEAMDAIRLSEILVSSGATVMQATPATWRMLVQSGWGGRPNLRMLCGGEALDVELAELLRPLGAELWNMYGPTEATIWSSLFLVKEGTSGPVSIGSPIGNTTMYILDEHKNPVPIGVAGELFIGGQGLALGYLNRPELTAERFVQNPLDAEGRTRLYRTGDGARYRKDGTIEFLGRLDSQVKVRGFRIELGEIESKLNEHPAVAQAVATVREDVPGDQRLVAYFIQDGEEDASPDLLQGHLKQSLPDYMVPSLFMALPTLPLTPNGKLDRKALPVPGGEGRTGRASFEAPETETEQAVAEVWQRVLRVDRVGLGDNFFDLGGHSLLAVQVHSALSDRLTKGPTLIDLFQYPTISGLARHLASSGSKLKAVAEAEERSAFPKETST